MKADQKLFVYGQLKYARYQLRAFGRIVHGRKAILKNYVRVKRKYFVIFPKVGAFVKGLVIELSGRELARADRYEEGYLRRKVRLADGSAAWAYIGG